MEDQEQDNRIDVITVDVPLFIRLLEFAREDSTDDMQLHSVAEKLIEMCQDGDIMTMEQYDEIVDSKDQVDTSNMNAVEDDMHPQNKNMNTINEQRWMKLAGIITEEVASKFKVGDTVLIQVNGQFETTPREIQSINGKFYGVSGTNKRPDGKGYSSEGGKEVAEDDIKLAGINEESSIPTIAKAELTDIPAMKGIGQTIKLTLSNGKIQHISPSNLEGIYGGDANDLDYFVGEKWED